MESSPAEVNGDDAGAVLCNLEEHGHGQIKMFSGGIAPSAVVIGQRVVRRAEISGRHQNGRAAGVAPLGVLRRVALDFETGTTAQSIVEQRRA